MPNPGHVAAEGSAPEHAPAASPSFSGSSAAEPHWLLTGRVPRAVIGFLVCDVALGLAHLLNAAAGAPYEKLDIFLSLEVERNLPTWYSAIQLFILASLIAPLAYHHFDRRTPRSWLLGGMAAVFLLMSIDEIAQVHEYLGYKSDVVLPGGSRHNTPFDYTGVWMFLIGIPFLVGMLWLFSALRSYFRAVPGVTTKYVAGLLVLVAGAAGVETASNFVIIESMASEIQIFFEEMFEMVGVTIMLWATLDLLRGHGFRIELAPTASK